MRYFLLCSILFAFGLSASAQKGRISGKITDGATHTPVEYATIAVFKTGSKTPVNGTTSDTKGNFTIGNLPMGEYLISVDFIGYQHYEVDHVTIAGPKTSVILNDIVIAPAQKQLQSVNIVAKTPTVENKIDKMVYNPANDLTNQGGVATDVLQKVPMVTVDIDGNVQLQGNSNIRFLINGKPSSIFGASLSDALQSIPASQIKSIEVITSPGAKYDAAGTGGIINIILKDSKVQGVNGSVNGTAGTRLENGSVNLNARKGNFGAGVYFSGNERINSTTLNSTNRQSYDAGSNTYTQLSQAGSNAFKRGGYQTGINFNWSITKRDELTAAFGFDHFNRKSSGSTTADIQKRTALGMLYPDTLSLLNSNSASGSNSHDYSLSYKKTFANEKQELDILYSSSSSSNTSDFSQLTQYLNVAKQPYGSIGNNPGSDKETDISIDYAQPAGKNLLIETGAKAVFENLNNTVVTDTLLTDGNYGPNALQTYSFNYKRNIYAAYLSLQFSAFHNFIDGKAGLRYERTDTQSDFNGTSIPGYDTFAPSFVLSHKIDDSQSIKLSFSYRIERPDYADLNPFYDISDPHNISKGNPDLKPELGHNYELGYNKTFDGGANIYFAGFYRYNTNDLQTFTTFYSSLPVNGTTYTDVSLTERSNLGREISSGASISGSVPLTDKFNLRSNMFFMDRINQTPGLPTVSGFAYRINFNASYTVSKTLVAEAFGNYNSSQNTIQGSRPAFAMYNIAMRKQLWNKKASIGLIATNPFSPYITQQTITTAANINQTSIRQVPFRSFGITLSYKFGKLEFKKDQDKEKDNNNPNMSQPDAGN